MAKIERFEDIKAWQLGRELIKVIYSLAKKKDFSKDYGLKDQIQRASVSIMSNISEGFERYSKKEFVQFLNIAKGSAGELRSHLYIALDLEYITEKEFNRAKDQCEVVSKHI